VSWTKREIVQNAFEEVGLASYAFDLQPEQFQAGLRRLDNMMATWNSRGLRIGYPLADNPGDSDLVGEAEIDACRLRAITQRGVEQIEAFARGHCTTAVFGALSGSSMVVVPSHSSL
jgi:hypothetical protein